MGNIHFSSICFQDVHKFKMFLFFCKRLCVCNNSPQTRSKRYFAKHIISVHHSNENKEVELQVLDKNDFLMFSIDFSKKGNADFTKKNLKKTNQKNRKTSEKNQMYKKRSHPPKKSPPSPLSLLTKEFFRPPIVK